MNLHEEILTFLLYTLLSSVVFFSGFFAQDFCFALCNMFTQLESASIQVEE